MVNGEWDFRAIEPGRIVACYQKRRCWLCGEPLGQYLAFVIGPMCAVNRISSEPPSHKDCAEYAVRACPFLRQPRATRNDVDLPGGTTAGIHLDHNPGATLIWITKQYHPVGDGRGGTLFQVGSPHSVHWYAEGRSASRAEIEAAMSKGLPRLRKIAEMQGRDAVADLNAKVADAMKLLLAE
jgi:hypothetical protein